MQVPRSRRGCLLRAWCRVQAQQPCSHAHAHGHGQMCTRISVGINVRHAATLPFVTTPIQALLPALARTWNGANRASWLRYAQQKSDLRAGGWAGVAF